MSTADPLARSITYVPLEQVLPAVRNAKLHDMPMLIGAIERFGFTNPLTVDERTGRLVAGHGRWHALVQMYAAGHYDAPRGVLTDHDGNWLVPLTRGWSSRDDSEAEAYIEIDNRLTKRGGYDAFIRSEMIEDLNANAPDLFALLNYSEEEMDEMVRVATVPVDPDALLPTDEAPSKDDGELDDDMGMTDVPDDPERKTVRCPECAFHFVPGDR